MIDRNVRPMKYAVIRQLTLIVISFSLFQSCSSADDEIYALVSVEINGISYSSKSLLSGEIFTIK